MRSGGKTGGENAPVSGPYAPYNHRPTNYQNAPTSFLADQKWGCSGGVWSERIFKLGPPGACGGPRARGAGMQERHQEMRELQAGSTRRARATEGPTVCSVTALQTADVEELTAGDVAALERGYGPVPS